MSLVQTISAVEYPESDGLPMGETDVHRKWMIRVYDLLDYRYREQRVYVACDLLVYYEEGEPSRYVVPDDFVVLDCEPGDRRIFKIWEEGRVPNAAFEVTSRSTRNEDTSHKPKLYARIGVEELFLYDPTSEYLSEPLQGFRLVDGAYHKIQPDETGALVSEQLRLKLRVENGRLVMYDRETGEVLQTAEEAAEQQAMVESQAREAAEARAKAAEDEVQRLQQELKRRSHGGD